VAPTRIKGPSLPPFLDVGLTTDVFIFSLVWDLIPIGIKEVDERSVLVLC
jgi:hypothetical protein